jgi:hydrogenase expression/formation protein HypC
VLRIDDERGLALCENEAGEQTTVEVALVEVEQGDSVLVHAGVALARLERAA